MSVSRHSVFLRFGIAAAFFALFGLAVYAQEADEETTDDSDEVEEIIVVAPKPGDRRRVDREYLDPTRARLLKENYVIGLEEEEYEWRKMAVVDSPSRIKWGYDPRDDYVRRNEIDLQDIEGDKNKPATLFRFEF